MSPAVAKATLRLIVMAPVLPWMRGPYQEQAGKLAKGLERLGHDVFFLTLGSFHADGIYSSATAIAQAAGGGDEVMPPADGEWDRLKYVGFKPDQKANSFCTNVNRIIHLVKSDAVIMLNNFNDVNPGDTLANIGRLDGTSVAWFPNHYDALDEHFAHGLGRFSHVAALAPSGAEVVLAAMPEANVTTIPHIVEPPAGFDASLPALAQRAKLRHKHAMPQDAVVVLVVAGNYDSNNRKSLDLALLAFKAFHEAVPNSFLFLRINGRNAYGGSGFGGGGGEVPLTTVLLPLVGLDPSSYTLSSAWTPYTHVLEMIQAADVLLAPSKTEGFGLPILEAQQLGTPVITTQFGAMADYTRYGWAVPPTGQRYWMSRGFCAMPDLQGTVAALHAAAALRAAAPHGSANRTDAIEWIRSEMSTTAVVGAFDALVAGAKYAPPARRLVFAPPSWAATESVSLECPGAKAHISFGVQVYGEPTAPLAHSQEPWTLVWATGFDVECAGLTAAMRALAQLLSEQPAARPGDKPIAMVLTTVDAEGTPVTRESDLVNGIVPLQTAVLLSTAGLVEARAEEVGKREALRHEGSVGDEVDLYLLARQVLVTSNVKLAHEVCGKGRPAAAAPPPPWSPPPLPPPTVIDADAFAAAPVPKERDEL